MDGDPITFRAIMEEEADEHLEPCSRCGQLFDCRDLSEILHHRRAQHEPLPAA